MCDLERRVTISNVLTHSKESTPMAGNEPQLVLHWRTKCAIVSFPPTDILQCARDTMTSAWKKALLSSMKSGNIERRRQSPFLLVWIKKIIKTRKSTGGHVITQRTLTLREGRKGVEIAQNYWRRTEEENQYHGKRAYVRRLELSALLKNKLLKIIFHSNITRGRGQDSSN